MPVEPPRTNVTFPSVEIADEHGRVMVGGDLEPGTLLAAYRSGLFPMRQPTGELTWWSPDPRGVLHVDALRVSKSLRRAVRDFEIRFDSAFATVIEECGVRDPGEYAWITTEIRDAFVKLHELGWAHSVEAWTMPTDGAAPVLAGGLYGVAIGGLFGGESMFHRRRDASKAALVGLVDVMRCDGAARLIDVQWLTPHMASLGAIEIPRPQYLEHLRRVQELPPPPAFLRRTPRERDAETGAAPEL